MKVHHIGYAVKDIDKAILQFEKLGYEAGTIVHDKIRNVLISFLKNGPECVELVAPAGNENPVDLVLKKTGPFPYHICYEVESIEKAKEILGSKWMLAQKPSIAPAINNCKVAFFYNKDIGMIELLEK